jgi:hypothetical protein
MKQKLLLLVALLCCAFNAKANVKFYGTEITQTVGYYFICNAQSGKFLNDDGSYSVYNPNKEDPTTHIYNPGSKPTVWCITQNSDGTVTISSGSKSIFITAEDQYDASASIAESVNNENASNHLHFKKSTHADGPGNANVTCYQFFHYRTRNANSPLLRTKFAGVLNGRDGSRDVFEALSESWIWDQTETENTSKSTRWVLLNTNIRANLTVSGTAKYGTFVAPFEVTLPTGVTAYKVNGYDETTKELTLEQVAGPEEKLDPNTAVIVENGTEATISKDYYGNPTGEENANSGDYLVGSYVLQPAPVGSYLLQYRTDPEPAEAIFLRVYDEDLYCGQNRAWFVLGDSDPTVAPSEIKSFTLKGTSTGITQIAVANSNSNELCDNAIYDLSGRRLSEKPARGLYIQNGKKILVK